MYTFARGIIFLTVSLLGFGLCFGLCFGQFAVADEFHYNNLLIGDRASGMGGAYTAISDDATGMFYNPAGIVYVGDRNFSASVNAYYSQTKKYENVIGNQPYVRKSSALLANYFGIVKPLGKLKLGFSYAVPDAVSEDQNQTFDLATSLSRFTINWSNKDTTINFGPSLAAEINDNLSVGITLYTHQRDTQLTVNQFSERVDVTATTPLTNQQWKNTYYRQSETGVRPILGVAWSPVEKLSLGFSLSQTFVLNSDTMRQDTCWDAIVGGCRASVAVPSIQVPSLASSNYKRQYPVRLAVGAAYFADKNLLLSGDLTYQTAVKDLYGDKMATINAALGTEYYLSKKWAVRAGLFTNRANTPNIQEGVTQIEEQINLYGASLSISNFSGSSSVTLGGSVNYGKGQSQIVEGKGVQDASTLGWLLFLSSSY